jgi:3-dehydroquinate dehydratase type I
LTPKICACVLPKTGDEAIRLTQRAESQGADFIEVRLDNLRPHDQLHDIASCSPLPKIATNRSRNHNGHFSGSETERVKSLLSAANAGFEYVDIELSTPRLGQIVDELIDSDTGSVLSHHDFKATPTTQQLRRILNKQVANRAELCKIVTTAKSREDNITILNFLHSVRRRARIISFAMGELGKPSRILSPMFGGFLTMASVEPAAETAPGQLTVRELKAVYRHLEA